MTTMNRMLEEGMPFKLAGTFQPALVILNDDSETGQKLQRVRVRISQLHAGTVDADLPWALPFHLGLIFNTPTVGTVDIPAVGARIWVYCPANDTHHLYYLGSRSQADVRLPELTAQNYPFVIAWIDQSGNRWYIDQFADVVDFWHVTGTRIIIDGQGSGALYIAQGAVGPNPATINPPGLSINVTGPVVISATGDTTIATQGNATVNANGNATVECQSNATVNAGGNATIESQGNLTLNSGQNVMISAQGDILLNAVANIILNSANENWTLGSGGNTIQTKGNFSISATGALNLIGSPLNLNTTPAAAANNTAPTAPMAPTAPAEPTAATARERPAVPNVANLLTY